MQITTTTQKSGKINILVDGDFRFSVPAALWFSQSLRDGDCIEEEELTALQEAAGSVFAYESALRCLSLRAHSEKELLGKLRRRYSAAAASSAVEKCRSLGLIDDEKFAFMLAGELNAHKGFAPARIVQELLSRGVDRKTAAKAAEALDTDEKISMMEVIKKSTRGVTPDEKGRARLVNRLLRLGYRPHEVFETIEELGWNTEFE